MSGSLWPRNRRLDARAGARSVPDASPPWHTEQFGPKAAGWVAVGAASSALDSDGPIPSIAAPAIASSAEFQRIEVGFDVTDHLLLRIVELRRRAHRALVESPRLPS
jgi:hypothetical protein